MIKFNIKFYYQVAISVHIYDFFFFNSGIIIPIGNT